MRGGRPGGRRARRARSRHRAGGASRRRARTPTSCRPVGTGPGRLHEHHRAGVEHLRQGAGVVGGVRRHLGEGHVAGLVDEVGELVVGDGVDVDPERPDDHLVDRRFLRVVAIGAHPVAPTGEVDHVDRVRPLAGGGGRGGRGCGGRAGRGDVATPRRIGVGHQGDVGPGLGEVAVEVADEAEHPVRHLAGEQDREPGDEAHEEGGDPEDGGEEEAGDGPDEPQPVGEAVGRFVVRSRRTARARGRTR